MATKTQVIDINGTPLTLSWNDTTQPPVVVPPPVVTPPPTTGTGPQKWADLIPVGKFRMPASGAETLFAMPGVAARDVNGKLQVFVLGSGLIELTPPSTLAAFSASWANTPRATLVKHYGSAPFQGVRKTWTAAGVEQNPVQNLAQGQLSFHNGLLYFTYYDAYNATGQKNWGLAAATLDGTVRTFGPWRVKVPVGSGFGYGPERAYFLHADPRDGSLLVGSTIVSNNKPYPWGPSLAGGGAWPLPTTPVGFAAPDLLVPKVYVDHPISGFAGGKPPGVAPTFDGWTTFRRKDWIPAFETSEGVETANPALTGGLSSWQQRDRISGVAAFTDVVFFVAELTDDHTWYNNPGAGRKCDHGKTDPLGVTGPTYTSRRLAVLSYKRSDMDAVAAGTKKPHEIHPFEVIDLSALGVQITPNNMSDPGGFAVTVVPSLRLVIGCSNRLEGAQANVGDRRTVCYIWSY